MCDSVVAAPPATAGGRMLFGKNSDRQRNEAHSVRQLAAATHKTGSELRCTYIRIPQVQHTQAVLLSQPYWIWGAEMGANAAGVVIGNEGLHARSAAPVAPALTGMDLVRLALERAQSAAEAVAVITDLLARHGQGGNCGHLTPSYYHNGFLVADAREAFALETVDRDWVIERVEGYRALSNLYSIADKAADASPALQRRHAAAGGGTYAALLGDSARQHLGSAGTRLARATTLLGAANDRIDIGVILSVLRDHGPDNCLFAPNGTVDARYRSLCMHAGDDESPGQTTGAMASEIWPGGALHWVTGTAAPCLSIFKPAFADIALPAAIGAPAARFDPSSLWWRHEALHRTVLAGGLCAFLDNVAEERDALEAAFRRDAAAAVAGDQASRSAFVARCWAEADALEARWRTRALAHPRGALNEVWRTMSADAGLEL